MKRLAKVAMVAAVLGLVGCDAHDQLQAAHDQRLAEMRAQKEEARDKLLAEMRARQAEYNWMVQTWRIREVTDDLLGTKDVYLDVKAAEGHEAYLNIRCVEGETRMTVEWDYRIANPYGTTSVTYRIGEQKAVRDEWIGSSIGKSVGLWDEMAIPVIKKMVNEKRFIFKVTGMPGSAVFNIEGLENHIGKLQDACNWK